MNRAYQVSTTKSKKVLEKEHFWNVAIKTSCLKSSMLYQACVLSESEISSPGLLHCRQTLYCLSYQESHLSLQFSSISRSCPTLCSPMDCSTPGLPVQHQLPETTQTHTQRVRDAIQPSHPLSSPSPPALNLSQHQSFQMSQLFALAGQSIGVSASTSVLPMNTQDWSPLGWTGWISLLSKGLSRDFSNTTVQKHQFSAQLPSQSDSHIHTWLFEKL